MNFLPRLSSVDFTVNTGQSGRCCPLVGMILSLPTTEVHCPCSFFISLISQPDCVHRTHLKLIRPSEFERCSVLRRVSRLDTRCSSWCIKFVLRRSEEFTNSYCALCV